MERIVSATEARIRFGEVMRRAVEDEEPVIVERGGKPHVVVLSVEQYERLKAGTHRDAWEGALERAQEVAARIQARRGGEPLQPPPEEVIRQMREGRSERLVDLH